MINLVLNNIARLLTFITYRKELQMLPFFKHALPSALLILIGFGNQAVAQSDFGQFMANVKRICELPNANPSEVAQLNEQLKKIYDDSGAEAEVKKAALAAFHAVSLEKLMDTIAEQIDEQMRKGNFARIGVPEFTTGENRTFDPAYGALPRSIAELLRNALAKKAQRHRSYSVLSEEALYKTLKDKKITPGDLGTGKTKNLRNNVDGKEISLLVDGRLNRVGEVGLTLRVGLIDNTTGSKLDHQFVGTALLNSDELAISGTSAKFGISTPGRSLRYRLEPGVGLVLDRDVVRVQSIRGASVVPHPLGPGGTSDGTFDVWIETRPNGSRGAYTKLPSDRIRFKSNDCYIGLAKGEEFQIVFKAQSTEDEDVFVRVLVDGLNTLSQHQKVVTGGTRGAYIVPVPDNSAGELVVAPRVSLEEARPWVVTKKDSGKKFVVRGFYNVDNKTDTLRRFQVVDADESVAARKNYTEQIGLITVAFYKGKLGTPTLQSRGSIGAGMGSVENTQVTRYAGDKIPGDMIAVYNIRYMTSEMLRQTVK